MDFSLKNIRNKIADVIAGKPKEVAVEEKGGNSSSSQITNSNIKNFIIKHVGWDSKSEDFEGPENDLSEVKAAIETDSYIKVALDKMAQLVLKSGYKYESKNQAALEYIKMRIALMEIGSGIPFDVLLTETARSLVYYSNCFWIKSRIDKVQGPVQCKPVFGKKPVGAYFIADPTIVEIKRGKDGTINRYNVSGEGDDNEYAAEHFIHFYVDRDASNNYGTPRIISALEDVRVLRKIEGNALSLIYRFAIPLYQCKIGTETLLATNQEIKEAEKALGDMSMDGIIVTNERTSFYAIGADNKAIDLSVYLNYFEKRVFTALNISEAMMGRGGSKQDSDSMEGLMHDTVKYYQAAMVSFVEKMVLNELLLEGGFNPILNEDDRVRFIFNEINLDTKIKLENHMLNQYATNAIGFEEMRGSIGRNTDTDENRLYSNMITKQTELELIKAKASAAVSAGNGNITNGKSASTKSNGTSKSVVSPSNQHGTTSAKMKEGEEEWHVNLQNLAEARKNPERSPAKNVDFIDSGRRRRMMNFKLKDYDVWKAYDTLRNKVSDEGKFVPEKREEYAELLDKEFSTELEKYIGSGYKNSLLSVENSDKISDEIGIPKELVEYKDIQIKNLLDELEMRINKSGDRNVKDCFDFLEYRIRFATEFISQKAYNYALVEGYRRQGVKCIKLKLSEGHSDRPDAVETDGFDIKDIPPYNCYCSCAIIRPEV